MKHAPTVIQGRDLYNRMFAHTDEPVADVLATGAEEIDMDGWYVVTWPEHVRTPRFNSDANYRGPMTEAEAREAVEV